MKIREILKEGSNAPLLTAIEMLRGQMRDQNAPAKIRTDSLIQLVQNTGAPFDYQALAAAVKNDPAVGEIIKNFNKHEVVFSTGENDIPGAPKDDGSTVERMAKRALNKRF